MDNTRTNANKKFAFLQKKDIITRSKGFTFKPKQ